MPWDRATGHSSSETATVAQVQATVCRPTDSGVATTGSIGTSARSYAVGTRTASAQKCGRCQQKTTPKKTTAGHASDPVTAAQPISTGAAPGTPPNSVDRRVCRLNTTVYRTA